MGNLLQNYFHGKPGKRDFTEADLPKDRIALFFSVLGVRWRNMFSLNLLYLLCWIPAAVWTFVNIVQLNYQLGLQGGTLADGFLGNLLFSYLLVLFPLTAFTGPFTAGISLVTRNWARSEHSFVWLDFKAAMKENWKQALGVSAISSLIPLLLLVSTRIYMQMAAQSALFYLPVALVWITALLWTLSSQLMYMLLISYELSFGQLLRNAFLMTFAALPKAALVRLLTAVMPVLMVAAFLFFPAALGCMMPTAICMYGLFWLSLNKLLTASYANAMCEKYLNAQIEGAKTNIGLRPELDEDDE